MSMDKTRLQHLLQRYLDAELLPEERHELQTLLLSEPDARRVYWREARLHAALRLLGEQVWGGRDTVPRPPAPSRFGSGHLPLWIAASVGVALLAALFWRMQGPSETIAELVDAQQARWEGSTLPTAPGSKLGRGSLRLAEGLARLRFTRGAEISLEGPVEVALINPQQCRLNRGSIVAHVPAKARGFSVFTPKATLVDHGTDFGVSTDETGHASVRVIQGEVELRHANGADSLRLTTREMAKITPDAILPVKGPAMEPRRPEADAASLPFTTEITTRMARGAAAYVSEPRTEGNQSTTLLLLKNCAEIGYGRKVLLRFDLDGLGDLSSITRARLTFCFGPSGYGYPSHGGDARIGVYAITRDESDFWSSSEVNWDTQPAFDPSSGRVDATQAVRVGEFIVPRGVQSGPFSIEGPELVARIKNDRNRLLTLVVVRENRIEQDGGLVLGIAGNNHPTLPPPTLRLY